MDVNSCPSRKWVSDAVKSLPGILLPGAAPAIEWDDLVPTDSSFANWTHLSIRSSLQPLQVREKCKNGPKLSRLQLSTVWEHGARVLKWEIPAGVA